MSQHPSTVLIILYSLLQVLRGVSGVAGPGAHNQIAPYVPPHHPDAPPSDAQQQQQQLGGGGTGSEDASAEKGAQWGSGGDAGGGGSLFAVLGPSGAGKTTLLDVLAGRRAGPGVRGEVRALLLRCTSVVCVRVLVCECAGAAGLRCCRVRQGEAVRVSRVAVVLLGAAPSACLGAQL